MSTPEITSQSPFSPRYCAAFKRLLATEGGFVNDRNDSGGATKYGLSLRFLAAEQRIEPKIFAAFDLGITGDIDVDAIRNLTPDEASRVYWRCFWLPVQAEDFPAPIGEMMFDQAVNDGLLAARKLLQRAVNHCTATWVEFGGCPAQIAVDGQLGPATTSALHWVLQLPAAGMPALVAAYRSAVASRYQAIAAADPTQAKFLNGWLARAANLGRGI